MQPYTPRGSTWFLSLFSFFLDTSCFDTFKIQMCLHESNQMLWYLDPMFCSYFTIHRLVLVATCKSPSFFGCNSVMLLGTVQNAESGTILTENDDWNLFHISTWVEQSMHACLTSKMTSRHTAYHMHDMYISRRFCIIHLLCSSRSQNVSSVISLLEYFLQKPAKKTTKKKMASYSYSSFTPVPFARNTHTEAPSTLCRINLKTQLYC